MTTKDRSINSHFRLKGHDRRSDGLVDNYITKGYNVNLPRVVSFGPNFPDWWLRIKEGRNATTGLQGSYTTIDSVPFRWVGRYRYPPIPTLRYSLEGDGDAAACCTAASLQSAVRVCTLDPTNAINKARAKFYKRLRSKQVQMSAPTFLGELGEALRMIRHPYNTLRDTARDHLLGLSKRKAKNPKRWKDAIAGSWLEHSFGWAPLINDAQDAAKAYSRLNEKHDSGPITASYVDEQDVSSWLVSPFRDGINQTFDPGLNIRVKFLGKATDRVIVKIKGHIVAAPVGMPGFDNWALFGFTPSEFVPTAWELLPWSFLVDYFSNVGDVLTASITNTARLAWTAQTVISEGQVNIVTRLDDLNTDQALAGWTREYLEGGGGRCTITRRDVVRSPGSFGLPDLSFNLVPSPLQGVNLAALWTQANNLHPQRLPRNWK